MAKRGQRRGLRRLGKLAKSLVEPHVSQLAVRQFLINPGGTPGTRAAEILPSPPQPPLLFVHDGSSASAIPVA